MTALSPTHTQLQYTCYPSSTAISSNAHVTVAIRSLHTCNPESLKPQQSHPASFNKVQSLCYKEHGTQFHISVQLLGIGGLPLHSCTVNTVASSILQPVSIVADDDNGGGAISRLLPTMSIKNNIANASHYYATWDDHHQNQHSSNNSKQNVASFLNKKDKNILTLPIRYKDLPRDASLNIQVRSHKNVVISTIIFNLWDEHGRLRQGLQKVRMSSTHSKSSPSEHESKANEHDSTMPRQQQPFDQEDSDEENDEKWQACLILDKLNQIEEIKKKEIALLSSSPSITAKRGTAQREQLVERHHHMKHRVGELNITVNGLKNCNSMQSVPWLDHFTKEHCIDILNERDEGELPLTAEALRYDKYGNYDSSDKTCLIIELPTCDVPIVHYELSYAANIQSGGGGEGSIVSTSTNIGIGGGASGSITALDLSLYHHQSQHQQMVKQKEGEPQHSKLQHDGSEMNQIRMPDPMIALDPLHEMGIKLTQVLDHESVDDNPAEDKYRTLQHDLLRGLVDPALKPDASERSRLNTVIGGTKQHLTREEKDLLWRFRFSLVNDRRALTKFLLAVEWTVESEVVQAAELLEQWRMKSPIEVSDALKLLDKNVAFQTGLVRAYAIDTLALADDGELVLYLLQLVQALKYENTTNDEHNGFNKLKKQIRGGSALEANKKGGSNNSNSLATFLIERASKNIELANYLYWYLKVELNHSIYGQRYREVFLAFSTKLSNIPYNVGFDSRQSKLNPLSGVLDSVSKISSSLTDSGSHKKPTASYRTMWNVLETQDRFISDVIECQLASQEARGKKDAKEKHLRDTLKAKGCNSIKNGVAIPLPSAPHIFVNGVRPDNAKMFKSALYPALLEFYVDKQHTFMREEVKRGQTLDGKTLSPRPLSSTYRVMVKTGDDLRQDQLVIMLIKLMDRILKRGTLDLFLKPYPILAMSDKTGLVEFVPESMAISQILAENDNSILHFFRKVAPSLGDPYDVDPDVMKTYVRSCAGYCVITYLIGVGDRHLDNIMLQRSGHFFHIDFGFIFGRDPKPLPPAFRLTKEMVDGMGGQKSKEYRQFCSLACQAYNLLRKRAGLVLNLLHLMSDAGIEDLSNNPSADAEGVIAKVEERFRLDLTDEQAEEYFVQLINECVSAIAPRVVDFFHQIAVARR